MFSLVIRESYTKKSTRNRQYSRRERPKVASKISSIVDEKKTRKTTKIQQTQEIIFDADHALKKELSNRKKFIRSFFSPSLPNRLGLCVSIDDDFCRYFWVPFRNGRSHRNIPPKKTKRLNETRLELTWDGPQNPIRQPVKTTQSAAKLWASLSCVKTQAASLKSARRNRRD